MSRLGAAVLTTLTFALSGCELLGIESVQTLAARKEADGKAVGGACRHAGRAIEDCYLLNRKADRSAVYAGWREMNEYMRENKLEAVVPTLKPETLAAPKSDEPAQAGAKSAAKAGEKPRKPDS